MFYKSNAVDCSIWKVFQRKKSEIVSFKLLKVAPLTALDAIRD